MKRRSIHLAACLLAALALVPAPSAQGRGAAEIERVPTWEAPPVDVEALFARDAENEGRKELPPKVGFPMKTAITTASHGSWSDDVGGDKVWRLRVASKDALWIVVGFTEFQLQPGAELYVSDAAGSRVLGPYTHADIRDHGQLWFPPLEGDTALVELFWPAGRVRETPKLRLGTVMHGYRPWGGIGEDAALEKGLVSGACNNDVACDAGNGWEDQVRSVVRLLDGSGSFCSGALVNNTSADCAPMVLSAYHCFIDPPSTTYQFNYQRSQCGGGAVETTHTITGSTRLARYVQSDFDLLMLDEEPPEGWNVYFSGWSRSVVAATRGTGIHHPSGDVKKISHNFDFLVSGLNWGSSHWRIGQWEDGTTEPRSSGSPLYDQNKRIVGQLHGGTASCSSITWDEYGKFDRSWAGGGTLGTRLSDHLDPDLSAPETLDGLNVAFCLSPPVLELGAVQVADPAGNGDGIADPGDTLELSPTLANTGVGQVATGVTATLVALTPGVTATGPVAAWPDLAGGEQAQPSAPLVVETVGTLVCGQLLEFRLDATANEGAWSETFSVATGDPMGTVELFDDDMETGVSGWTTLDLEPPGNNWFRTTARSNSPNLSWFVNNLSEKSDSILMLDTATNLAPGSILTFSHFMNSEATFDGGVLEYSVDGGGSWIDAGSMITQGGYNLTISSLWQSNLAGRDAWTGDLNGWQEVIVDLAPLAGQAVTIRWRFASDTVDGDEGWFLDDVNLMGGVYACSDVQPGESAAPGRSAPFRIEENGEMFSLSWGTPPSGGIVTDYVLYSMPLVDLDTQTAECDGSLGSGTSADAALLRNDVAFLVVARNGLGEGSYGTASDGTPRLPALTPCP